MDADVRGHSAGAEDCILPMNLVQLEYPSEHETHALELLYQAAAQAPWVLSLGDSPDVPQATDLATALEHGEKGRWTRGLLVQVRCPDYRHSVRCCKIFQKLFSVDCAPLCKVVLATWHARLYRRFYVCWLLA